MAPPIDPIRPHAFRARPRRGVTPHNTTLSAVCESCSRTDTLFRVIISAGCSRTSDLSGAGAPLQARSRGGARPFNVRNHSPARNMPLCCSPMTHDMNFCFVRATSEEIRLTFAIEITSAAHSTGDDGGRYMPPCVVLGSYMAFPERC